MEDFSTSIYKKRAQVDAKSTTTCCGAIIRWRYCTASLEVK
jgi:hypothetical protein